MFSAAAALAKFIATKAFLIGLFYIGLPILVYNFLLNFIIEFIDYGMQYIADANVSELAIQFTGMGGWIANQIMLPQAFAVFMSFLAIRFVMRFIPFLK